MKEKQVSVYEEIRRQLPEWAKIQNIDKWVHWVKNKASSCQSRSRKHQNVACGDSNAKVNLLQWREAVLKALKESKGKGRYSQFDLDITRKCKHPLYPSIEHLEGLHTPKLAVETRIVNDMKSILAEREFFDIISHISFVNGIRPRAIKEEIKLSRSF
ncbi:hypothetical protein KAU32_10425 [bacterium]|nr:hypothetical protein [bacterium]